MDNDPEKRVQCGGGFKVAVGEEGVQTIVGAGQSGEVPFYVAAVASWVAEEVC